MKDVTLIRLGRFPRTEAGRNAVRVALREARKDGRTVLPARWDFIAELAADGQGTQGEQAS